MTQLADRFRVLEAELGDRRPKMLAEARTLAAAVADPLSSGIDRCWEVTWEKPLYANTKITPPTSSGPRSPRTWLVPGGPWGCPAAATR